MDESFTPPQLHLQEDAREFTEKLEKFVTFSFRIIEFLKKLNRTMKNEDYLKILQENLKSSADWLLGAVGCSNRTMIPTHKW